MLIYDEDLDLILFEAVSLEEVLADDMRDDRAIAERLNFHAGE